MCLIARLNKDPTMRTPEPIITQNALLQSASLRREQLTNLVVTLRFIYGNGNTQKYGPVPATEKLIRHILDVTESEEWSEVQNKPVRVRGTFAEIMAIGHFLLDNWIEDTTST